MLTHKEEPQLLVRLPNGIIWEGNNFRTGRLVHGYEATEKVKNASILSGDPNDSWFEPSLAWLEHLRRVYQEAEEE